MKTKFIKSVIGVDQPIDKKINNWIDVNPNNKVIDIKFQTDLDSPLLTASALIIYEDDGSSEGYSSDEEYWKRTADFLKDLEGEQNEDQD